GMGRSATAGIALEDGDLTSQCCGVVRRSSRPWRVAKDCLYSDRRLRQWTTECGTVEPILRHHSRNITSDTCWCRNREHALDTGGFAFCDAETVVAVDAHQDQTSCREFDIGPNFHSIVVTLVDAGWGSPGTQARESTVREAAGVSEVTVLR